MARPSPRRTRHYALAALALAACSPDTPRGDKDRPEPDSGTSTGTTPIVGTTTPTPTPTGLNVLLVIADDLGVDKLQAHNPTLTNLPRQPTLDALAADGVRFPNAWVAPLCSPTRAAILTGRHPHQLGIGQAILLNQAHELPLGELTLPEMFAEAGYVSAAFGKWHLNSLVSEHVYDHPNLQGFDHYSGAPANLNQQAYDDYVKVIDGEPAQHTVYATTDTVDDAAAWIQTAPEPWFSMVAFHAPHTPIHRPPDALLPEPLDPYADEQQQWNAMVESMDHELGRLLDSLDPALRDRTTIVFIGDNGTLGSAILPPYNPNRDKGTLYEGGIRVPLIVTGPAIVTPGTTSEALANGIDLFPTLTELAGVDPSTLGGGLRPGHSLVPQLRDPEAAHPRLYNHSERFQNFDGPPFSLYQWAIRDDRYKLAGIQISGQSVLSLFDMDSGAPDEGEPLAEPYDTAQEEAYNRLVNAHVTWLIDEPWAPEP